MAEPVTKMIFPGALPSFLKVWYYRLRGAKIGRNVKIGLFSVIQAKDLQIGDGTRIGMLTFIQGRKVSVGKRCRINMMVAIDVPEFNIDNDSTIMEQVIVGGMVTPRSKLNIGKRVKIFPFSFINPTEPVIIEDDVGIGGANYIFTHGSWQNVLDGFPIGFGPVTIKKGAWFPWRVFVLPNVEVGEFSTIGAGSVINKNIPPRSLAAGVPAKVIKENGAHIKSLSIEEKHCLLLDIFNEYLNYLNFKNPLQRELINFPNGLKFKIAKRDFVYFKKPDEFELINGSILVTLEGVPKELLPELKEKAVNWFDIENKLAPWTEHPDWLETKDFLSRYGIRFEHE